MRRSTGVDVVIITGLKAALTKKRFYVVARNVLRTSDHYQFATQIRDNLDGFLGKYFITRGPNFNPQQRQRSA